MTLPANVSLTDEVPAVAKPSAEPALDVGSRIDGRFRVEEVVGRSGMATLYRAMDESEGREVALKIPVLSVESDPVGFSRFMREEEIGIQLDHPNLIKVFAVPGEKSRPYIVMEFLRGKTLAHLLRAAPVLPEIDALRIASAVCGALEYLHERGFVHRDLKPANIMLCDDGSLRVFDLGLAAAPERRKNPLAKLGHVFGTPEYMAPEQVENDAVDERADLYSLGAILYEMTCGEVPFRRDDPWQSAFARTSGDPIAPRKVNPALSPAVEEIILHAMQRNPRDRYVTVAAFKSEIDAPEQVTITGYCERLRAPRFKLSFQGTPILTGILLGLGALTGLVGMFWLVLHALPRR